MHDSKILAKIALDRLFSKVSMEFPLSAGRREDPQAAPLLVTPSST